MNPAPHSPSSSASTELYVGLMSGTSLDGVDGVLAAFDQAGIPTSLAHAHLPFPAPLRAELMALQQPGSDEIDREATAANQLARIYAQCVRQLVAGLGSDCERALIRAIGVHGQTIRHRPERGYTRQTNNPALLAELTGIDVVADLRSRDIAAGGQGAPLVPAFHRAAFGSDDECRVLLNIGGIANISVLDPAQPAVTGYDTGPGNVLMDLWALQHLGQPWDDAGRWAASGQLVPQLLQAMASEPYFSIAPPKSTGRDLFHAQWLDTHLRRLGPVSPPPVDVQRTLAELTAASIADAIAASAANARSVFVCGGGARNPFLLSRIQAALASAGSAARVKTTEDLGIAADQVEALAFAWLARQFMHRLPGNLPAVTGAVGPRVLGALHPA